MCHTITRERKGTNMKTLKLKDNWISKEVKNKVIYYDEEVKHTINFKGVEDDK